MFNVRGCVDRYHSFLNNCRQNKLRHLTVNILITDKVNADYESSKY